MYLCPPNIMCGFWLMRRLQWDIIQSSALWYRDLGHLGTSLNTQWGVSTVSNVVGRTGSYFYTHTDSPETVLRVWGWFNKLQVTSCKNESFGSPAGCKPPGGVLRTFTGILLIFIFKSVSPGLSRTQLRMMLPAAPRYLLGDRRQENRCICLTFHISIKVL